MAVPLRDVREAARAPRARAKLRTREGRAPRATPPQAATPLHPAPGHPAPPGRLVTETARHSADEKTPRGDTGEVEAGGQGGNDRHARPACQRRPRCWWVRWPGAARSWIGRADRCKLLIVYIVGDIMVIRGSWPVGQGPKEEGGHPYLSVPAAGTGPNRWVPPGPVTTLFTLSR